MAPDDETRGRTLALDAAEELFYAHGVQAVGMDRIRAASGLSLKRLYALYPGKDALVAAYLDRRDARWRAGVTAYADARPDPRERLLAVFDWLGAWCAEPGFRGCAWINAHGELGAGSPAVAGLARRHKEAFRAYVETLARGAGLDGGTASAVHLLAEGVMVTAAILPTPSPGGHAARARHAVALLLDGADGRNRGEIPAA